MNRFKIYDLGFKNNALIFILTSCFLLLASTLLAYAQEAFVGPGDCTTKEECRKYCDEDGHREECLKFAVENGLMTQEEVDKALKYLKQAGPGGCRGEECKTYCEDKSHREECLNFAEEHGFISEEEAARARKFRAIELEGGPGGCKGEECRVYCEEESHHDECFAFAREKGLLQEGEIEDYETGLKIREKIKESGGPGGCTSENECQNYCSNISHVEECVEFGATQTGKSPDEVRRMLEEFERHKERLQNSPSFRGFDGAGFGGFEDREREEFENNEEFKRPEMNQGEFQSDFRGYPDMRTMNEEDKRRLMEEYQSQNPMPTDMPTMFYPESDERSPSPPPPDFQPTSYDRSRSLISNVISAFLAPFRK